MEFFEIKFDEDLVAGPVIRRDYNRKMTSGAFSESECEMAWAEGWGCVVQRKKKR